ncbi:cation-transporting P-type ATPase [Propionivibrio sp.]|uniref:cation-transporting P-type ATPase n=1 Tax=Propionivibrio sp. TaxID=2212460 RepID=UPI003BF299BE
MGDTHLLKSITKPVHPDTAWQAHSTAKVLRQIESDTSRGLTTDVAQQRPGSQGSNRLAESHTVPLRNGYEITSRFYLLRKLVITDVPISN